MLADVDAYATSHARAVDNMGHVVTKLERVELTEWMAVAAPDAELRIDA